MEIYKGTIELLDYVFYATMERGKIFETGAYIHNYALAYAIRIATSSAYFHSKQKPNYESELKRANEIGIYITPAKPIRAIHRQVQFNTIAEIYGFQKSRSIGYPDWGFIRVLKPESSFEFFIIQKEDLPEDEFELLKRAISGETIYVRFGKFPGKAKITLEKADQVSKTIKGDFNSTLLLNWRDLRHEPKHSDIFPSSLPTKLIENAFFEAGEYTKAIFKEKEVDIPMEMYFLAKISKRARKKKK